MSAHVSRKRSRAEDDGEGVPPAKRESEHHVKGTAGTGQTQTTASDGGQVFKKDREFWFDDGTVIFVARDTEFRVYKGVLASLSTVFKTLFADRGHTVRNVSIDEEQTILCPIVRLLDSPQDLRHLLRVCFFSKRLESLYEEKEPSYDEISAGIRLGEKYKIAEWYSQSLVYLKSYFPRTMNRWTALESCDGPPGWEFGNGIGVISLARKTEQLSILPAAFLSCMFAESDSPATLGIGHGFTTEDGSRQYLSPGDLTTCFHAKTSIRVAIVTSVFRTFEPEPSTGCKTSSTCKKVLREVLVGLGNNSELLLSCNPFSDYDSYFSGTTLAICRACTTMVKARSLKERQDVWNRLPELLGIDVPGWAEE
ncbi:hypothetical protein GSI_12020 [Ganoderma sinense ZZ0214-1]|uniref:BTB domain-containing protein n=1 Tax=Ganoderma sinense ZZ0214-1 TaxID=1077348 RepID=A0A2G8RXP5_9APHY|nr:hypothetical protein GSI_12020 [Ganoderma sinense ZZ0214-1]